MTTARYIFGFEGRVQGVNFRGWAREQAELLGLSGWIRNRRDGGGRGTVRRRC